MKTWQSPWMQALLLFASLSVMHSFSGKSTWSGSAHSCSWVLVNPATGAPLPLLLQDLNFIRMLKGRDRETALIFLTILYVFWYFKDTTELLGVAWLILLPWNRAQTVIDFKVSLFNLALQSVDAELQFSNRRGGVACFLDYPLLGLLINQA